MKLKSITFCFDTHEVIWKWIGKAEIAGRIYPNVYKVIVCPGNFQFTTSMNANKTNSIDFIKQNKKPL